MAGKAYEVAEDGGHAQPVSRELNNELLTLTEYERALRHKIHVPASTLTLLRSTKQLHACLACHSIRKCLEKGHVEHCL